MLNLLTVLSVRLRARVPTVLTVLAVPVLELELVFERTLSHTSRHQCRKVWNLKRLLAVAVTNKRSRVYCRISQGQPQMTTVWTPGTPDPASDCFEGPPVKSRCLSSVASDCSMSNETVVTLDSVSGGDHRRHRKPGDCRRLWHSEWGTAYLVRYDDKSNKCVCLKCN